MKVTKANLLKIKTMSGTKTCEILKLTKYGVEYRNVADRGQDTLLTGFEFCGIRLFWELVGNGTIEIA